MLSIYLSIYTHACKILSLVRARDVERERERETGRAGFGWRPWRHGNGVAHLIKPRCGNRRPIDRRAAGCRYLAPAKCGRCSSDLVCLAAAAFALGCKANKPARAPDGRSDGCVTPSALYGYHSAQGPEVTVRVHSQLTWPASQPIRDAYEPYIYIYMVSCQIIIFSNTMYNTTSGKRTCSPGFAIETSQ